MHHTRRNLLLGAGAMAAAFMTRKAFATLITSFPTTDLESGKFDLGANNNYASPAPHPAMPGHGVTPSAFRLSDDGVLDGNDHTVYCSDGPNGISAMIQLYRSSQGRLSESTVIQDLRFGYARYGIMTPWGADRPPTGYSVDEWYRRGQHIIRRVRGQAYAIGIRIAAYDTLIEDCILSDCGGTDQDSATGSEFSRTFGILLNGPNPTVRRSIIRRIKHGDYPAGQEQESVGLGFGADCHGGTIENVEVSNPAQLSCSSIALWIGHSDGVIVRNFTAKSFKYALDTSDATILVENSCSINCENGFGRPELVNDPRIKYRNVWDHKLVNGVWQSVDVSNV